MAKQSQDAQSISSVYRAYLVRLWRENEQAPWHASAQSVDSREIMRFATLEALFAYFEEQTEDGDT